MREGQTSPPFPGCGETLTSFLHQSQATSCRSDHPDAVPVDVQQSVAVMVVAAKVAAVAVAVAGHAAALGDAVAETVGVLETSLD